MQDLIRPGINALYVDVYAFKNCQNQGTDYTTQTRPHLVDPKSVGHLDCFSPKFKNRGKQLCVTAQCANSVEL